MTRSMLLGGAALALAVSAPALAQDARDPMTPAPAAEAQAQQTLTLQPGARVLGSDGAPLGTLEGVRTDEAGAQQLTVRGADGQIRGVPVNGIAQQGADISVGLSSSEFGSAEIIAEGDGEAAAPQSSTPPTLPAEPADPVQPDSQDDPAAPAADQPQA
ncbi:MAG TPA: superoxide dismutase [Brevundimonas sp.]|jgi:hypothetical protein|uniref:superoxide dismutase n=1 Tax=Brevundimonas sp. TaxID=1871086 RepID=UPI002E151BC2|nr:superoxide dismutase [Brevundimonas sp.]